MESGTQGEKKNGIIAGIVGGILILVGLILAVANVIIYVGEWPNERPVYLAGIGYPMFVLGIFSALAGLYFFLAEPKAPAVREPEAGGKGAN